LSLVSGRSQIVQLVGVFRFCETLVIYFVFVTSFIPTKILTISQKIKQSKTYFLKTFYQWGHKNSVTPLGFDKQDVQPLDYNYITPSGFNAMYFNPEGVALL
jgi:hypothetical protein